MPPTPPAADAFPPDYFAARDRFRAAAARLGWLAEAHPIAARGPGGEELTLDVATSGPPGSGPVVVVSSGVHGVEGFVGSAVQLAAMSRPLPDGVRYLFVHAVSPFGFAHVRRFDEGNVDLNRNFLFPGEKYAGCPPTYAALDGLLNPPHPPAGWDWFWPRAALAVARYGWWAVKRAVVAGQYEFPKGLFFGGHGPAASHRVFAAHFPRWVAGATAAVHLDYHTGLGDWGAYKLITDDPFPADVVARVGRWFGPGRYEPPDGDGVGYHTRGGFGRWCTLNSGVPGYVFLCAEFGTYAGLTVTAALRAENRAHHWGTPDAPATRAAKRRLKETFVPAAPAWRDRVLADGVRLIHQAAAGLRG